VAGVLLPPAGYSERCFQAVRAAGGVCVADEVQASAGIVVVVLVLAETMLCE